MVREKILCAGFGGQGIMTMGKLLAYTAMGEGYNVTWVPSYGAEVRSGTAHSMVRIQKEGIENPIVVNPSICVVLNELSLMKFAKRVLPKGLLLIDDTDIKNIPKIKNIIIKKAPFTKIALELGDKRAANMIAIGALNKIKSLFSIEALIKSLPIVFGKKQDIVSINEKALKKGYELF